MMQSTRSDQRLVIKFLDEFVSRLTEKHDIDFILLFGSAARGEWRRGVSDVDLIIQVRRQEDKERVRKHAEKLFWSLDEKYGTRFKEVCSASDEAHGLVEELLKKGQRRVRLYAPFEVFAPEDVDWSRGEFSSPFFKIGLTCWPRSTYYSRRSRARAGPCTAGTSLG